MSHHYTKATESDLRWCPRCNRRTTHSVSNGRLGRCAEHEAPQLTQDQQRRQETQRRELEQPSLFKAE